MPLTSPSAIYASAAVIFALTQTLACVCHTVEGRSRKRDEEENGPPPSTHIGCDSPVLAGGQEASRVRLGKFEGIAGRVTLWSQTNCSSSFILTESLCHVETDRTTTSPQVRSHPMSSTSFPLRVE